MTILGSQPKSYLNISSLILFSFFKKLVHTIIKPVQTSWLWASKFVQPQRRYVQLFAKDLNIPKGDLYSFFLEKLNMLRLNMFRLGYPIVKKRDAE